jgi:hypothetical protein
MNETQGWYIRLVLPDGSARTQWLTIDHFWLCTFHQRRDRSPSFAFHLSLAQISEALSETGQLHSVKFIPGHSCNYKSIFFYTPNQFDIAAIKRAIQTEQEKWEQHISSSYPEVPQSFIVDLSGKFIFRPADRLTLTVERNLVTVQQPNQNDLFLIMDSHLDIHPTLEAEQDVRWIQVHFWSDSLVQSLRLHCSEVSDMMQLVSLLLHCKAQLILSE